jgi:D-alanyl-D-alanine dipeptidase
VPLGAFSDFPQIATDSIYVGERTSSPYPTTKLDGALFTVFVRQGVAERLAKAAAMLPRGHMLLVWDAYRTLSVQQALFDYFVKVLVQRGIPREQAIIDAQQFVSIPSGDPTRPPPHNTGGAVDLTIIYVAEPNWQRMEELMAIIQQPETPTNWRDIYAAEMERQQLIREAAMPLPMGTVFDGVCGETATRFYEDLDENGMTGEECVIRTFRRLLYNVMTAVGFSNYPAEWWHFDVGNQFAAKRTGKPAIYGAAVLSEENHQHEAMRRDHYMGCVRIHDGAVPQTKVPHELLPFVKEITARTGDIRHTTHPRADAI